ncbi:MAG: alpha/beta hydrolase [Fuerstiella sp.]|nr:alpha/beta hydrolase [Fuerstiella sp.]MCP4505427.1 alpha/beta hydrolase [Fuerstiella sp.]
MDGIFRYGKSIATSLTIALLALGGRYGQSWFFTSVEDPQATSDVVLLDKYAQTSRSHSPMRSLTSDGRPNWKIAIVTDGALAAARSLNENTNDTGPAKSLAQDAIYATPSATFGFADVTLPIDRRRGECPLNSSSANQVIVNAPEYSANKQFYAALGAHTDNAEAKDVFVFVHGFNVTTDHALGQAAQLAEDMPFHGVVVTFSWRSVGRSGAYLTDEVQAERYFWNLAELLANLRSQLKEDVRLHVMAHSMGNRVTLRALNALTGTLGPTGLPIDPLVAAQLSRFGNGQLVERRERITAMMLPARPNRNSFQTVGLHGMDEIIIRFPQWGTWSESQLSSPPLTSLILAAPDVDAQEFGMLVGNIVHVAGSMIRYASDTDQALKVSQEVHGGAYRAGDSRAQIAVAGLQTVCVSGVSTNDPLGHSYCGSNPAVLTQLARLFRPPVQPTISLGTIAREQSDGTSR